MGRNPRIWENGLPHWMGLAGTKEADVEGDGDIYGVKEGVISTTGSRIECSR